MLGWQEETDDDADPFPLGFQQSRPKAKAKAATKSSAGKTSSKASKATKTPKKSHRDKEEKDNQALKEASEEAIKKLEQLTPKGLWNKRLSEKETASRLNQAASLVSDLAIAATSNAAGFSGLKHQLETTLTEVERSRSFVSQLQNWSGDLAETFLRSSSFVKWFGAIDSVLQQAILVNLGTKLIEA